MECTKVSFLDRPIPLRLIVKVAKVNPGAIAANGIFSSVRRTDRRGV
jgi:hypothetical protein